MKIGGLYKITLCVLHFTNKISSIRSFDAGTILTYLGNEDLCGINEAVFLYDNEKYYIQLPTEPDRWLEEIET